MKYLIQSNGRYKDETGQLFKGVVPRDLEVNDRFEAYSRDGVKAVQELVVKEYDEYGGLTIETKVVA